MSSLLPNQALLPAKSELYKEIAQTTSRIVAQFNQLSNIVGDPSSLPTVNKGDIYRDVAASLQKIIGVLDKLAEAEGAEPIQRATIIKKQKKELKQSGFWTTEQLNLLQELVLKYNDNPKNQSRDQTTISRTCIKRYWYKA